ncbi:MAG: sigma-70 family RNA polymerase sigma factor [Magnetococcales bacterium]|nr:sigma-70 family RNA polymerase sigma factor [Magnetococcales bacterium]
MNSGNSYHGIDTNAVRVIRFKARQLSRLPGFSCSEIEDLEQEMVIDVLRRLPNFDPARSGLPTFISRIIGHCAATLVTRKRADSLKGTMAWISLDELETGFAPEMMGTPSGMDHIHLAVDIGRLLGRLPNEHRRICQLLVLLDKPAIPQRLGMGRTTFYRRLGEIRSQFLKAGMQNALAAA